MVVQCVKSLEEFEALKISPFVSKSVRNQTTIIETPCIIDVLPYLTESSLCIFDLDNTIMQNQQTLGSDQWFEAQIHHQVQKGRTVSEAVRHILPDYNAVNLKSGVVPVEAVAQQLIAVLQVKNIETLALTARGEELEHSTQQQLSSLGISFNLGRSQNIRYSAQSNASLASRGIIFAAGSHKGHCLKEYLAHLAYTPSQIVFVDDKLKNVQNVADVAKELGVAYIGVRYKHLDEQVKQYKPEVAAIQFELFKNFLTDEEAEVLLQHRQRKSKNNVHEFMPKQAANSPAATGLLFSQGHRQPGRPCVAQAGCESAKRARLHL